MTDDITKILCCNGRAAFLDNFVPFVFSVIDINYRFALREKGAFSWSATMVRVRVSLEPSQLLWRP